MSHEAETIDLTGDADEVAALRARIADLEDENAHLSLQLAVMSSTDAITGLANRTGLVDAIEMALYRLQRMAEPFAVVGVRFPDLGQLTDESDRADAVRDLGALLAASLRNVDRVGRLDATTFAVVLANVPADHVATVTERTRAMIDRLPSALGLDVTLTNELVAVSVVDPERPGELVDVLAELESMLDDGADPPVRML